MLYKCKYVRTCDLMEMTMKARRLLLCSVSFSLLLVTGCSSLTKPSPELLKTFDPCDSPNVPTLYVPKDRGSIADAVMELGDHGRVVVAPSTYRENIKILAGRHVIIQAEGPEHPEIFPADHNVPVVTVAPGAKLCLNGLSLHGGQAGLVAGNVDTGDAAGAVTMLDTRVADAGYGVYGIVDQFHIERSSIENNIYGLVLAGDASLFNVWIAENEFNMLLSGGSKPSCAAAAWSDTGSKVVVQNVTIMYGKQGGLAICNTASATVKNVYVWKNGFVGAQIRNVNNFTFDDSRVGETQLWNGGWGDGLQVVHSNGIVKDSQFSANKRANIIYYGKSGGTIDNNLIVYGVFSIALEGLDGSSPNPMITPSNYMYGNKENRVTHGRQLSPTPPLSVPPP